MKRLFFISLFTATTAIPMQPVVSHEQTNDKDVCNLMHIVRKDNYNNELLVDMVQFALERGYTNAIEMLKHPHSYKRPKLSFPTVIFHSPKTKKDVYDLMCMALSHYCNNELLQDMTDFALERDFKIPFDMLRNSSYA